MSEGLCFGSVSQLAMSRRKVRNYFLWCSNGYYTTVILRDWSSLQNATSSSQVICVMCHYDMQIVLGLDMLLKTCLSQSQFVWTCYKSFPSGHSISHCLPTLRAHSCRRYRDFFHTFPYQRYRGNQAAVMDCKCSGVMVTSRLGLILAPSQHRVTSERRKPSDGQGGRDRDRQTDREGNKKKETDN